MASPASAMSVVVITALYEPGGRTFGLSSNITLKLEASTDRRQQDRVR
jgi:hypothetical protein